MSLFEELQESLAEAVDIKNGAALANRVTTYELVDVKLLRSQLSVTQKEFAEALGTNINTIKSWESRRRNPTGLAAKILITIQANPKIYQQIASI